MSVCCIIRSIPSQWLQILCMCDQRKITTQLLICWIFQYSSCVLLLLRLYIYCYIKYPRCCVTSLKLYVLSCVNNVSSVCVDCGHFTFILKKLMYHVFSAHIQIANRCVQALLPFSCLSLEKYSTYCLWQVFRSSLHPPDYQSRLDIVRANSKTSLDRTGSFLSTSGTLQVRYRQFIDVLIQKLEFPQKTDYVSGILSLTLTTAHVSL